MADCLLSSLEEYFYQQGQTFDRAEILALIAGEGTVSPANSGGAIFTVKNSDPNYHDAGLNAVITDIRLYGKTGYPVYTTQNNVEFRSAELTFSPSDSTVTISNFNLQDGEHITIFAIGAASPQTFDTVLSRLTALEKTIAPILNGSTVLIWDEEDPAAIPPDGWVEVTDYTGRMMIGRDGSVVAFNTVGKIGGATTVALTADNNAPHSHIIDASENGQNNGSMQKPGWSDNEGNNRGTFSTHSSGSGTPFSILPPYKVVRYIRYTG